MINQTFNQLRYSASIRNPFNNVIIGVGPAGTGKTSIPCAVAVEMLAKKQIKKVLITRPAVCADENHGFLPGNIDSKMLPYVIPIYDSFNKHGMSHETLRSHLLTKTIEICPLSYIRGRTFSNCFLLADEAQNCTINQMKLLLTRIGENCKTVITGDLDQSDLVGPNGLKDLLDRLDNRFETCDETCIDVIKMGQEDVMRSKVVREILELYKN